MFMNRMRFGGGTVQKAISTLANPTISTAQAAFGTSSLEFSASQAIWASDPTLAIGSQDFTIRCRFMLNSTNHQYIMHGGAYPFFNVAMSNTNNSKLGLYLTDIGGWPYANGPTSVSNGVWHDLELSRSGTSILLFLDGNLEISAPVPTSYVLQSINNNTVVFGGFLDGGIACMKGYLDACEVIVGRALHTANFTPPTSAPVNVAGTQLLLNFEGPNGSTVITDDTTGR